MTQDRQSDDAAREGAAGTQLSRREFFKGLGAGLATAAVPLAALADAPAVPAAPTADGTPEQIHLTWGEDPAGTVHVSWASPAQAQNPRVLYGRSAAHGHTAHAVQRTYTDALNGQTVFTYHARLDHLEPGTAYHYAVTADNSSHKAQPFSASFRTAPRGRVPFRWTSFGDLATPVTAWKLSSPQARHAVAAVERFEPLFHLLNGDLCYADLNPTVQPAVWADFGNNNQASAAFRPWMPCPGNHEIEFGHGADGFGAYLTRYTLPDNGTPFPGRWYSFRVGTALFISLSADDVVYQDAGPFVHGPESLTPAPSTGNAAIAAGTSLYVRGYSGGEQTRWLEKTLAAAAADHGIDWIVVQMHQDALSSSRTGNGSDRGIREAWLPLFDRYGVDLVLCGHDHDYERSWPVRGCRHDAGKDAATGMPVDTWQPLPVVTATPANGSFDTSRGTIHLVLGCGGTSIVSDVYGTAADGKLQAKVFTKPNRPVPDTEAGKFVRHPADALEEAIWSAQRNPDTGYGIAVFDLDPGHAHGKTSITIRYFHAPGADKTPNASYELFETVVLAKSRRGSHQPA